MNAATLRQLCAQKLTAAQATTTGLRAFVGLDGFVDEIIHVVDKRDDAETFQRLPTIARLAERLAGAAGRSTNIELVNKLTKLGGNGPIMANALASFGMKVTYLGALGYPVMHPVFDSFSKIAEVHTLAEAGHTDALEFEDGKLMLGKTIQLGDVNWRNIQDRFGPEKFRQQFAESDLVAFVNWTMIPHMSDIWDSVQAEICPALGGPRRKIFFDLADPEKRTHNDICRALELITRFQKHFDVILGLNEKEAYAIGDVLGFAPKPRNNDAVAALARELQGKLPIDTLVVHPVTYALAVSGGVVDQVEGPHVPVPVITTGAGDHFNAGFCLGKLLGLNNAMSVLTGVATSGFYVRSGESPTIPQLAELMNHWPERP